MATLPNNPSPPAPATSWWGRLSWWKKTAAILCLALTLGLATEWVALVLSMPKDATVIPEYATALSIESRYKAQLDRMKEIADAPPKSRYSIEAQKEEKDSFSVPEIVSVKFHEQTSSGASLGTIIGGKEQHFKNSSKYEFSWHLPWNSPPPRPATYTEKHFRTLQDESQMTVLVYHAPYTNKAGKNLELILEFDLDKLKP